VGGGSEGGGGGCVDGMLGGGGLARLFCQGLVFVRGPGRKRGVWGGGGGAVGGCGGGKPGHLSHFLVSVPFHQSSRPPLSGLLVTAHDFPLFYLPLYFLLNHHSSHHLYAQGNDLHPVRVLPFFLILPSTAVNHSTWLSPFPPIPLLNKNQTRGVSRSQRWKAYAKHA